MASASRAGQGQGKERVRLGLTRWWPKTRKVHQTRGDANTPARSYTTTVDSLVMPRASAAAANSRSEGSMCGRSVDESEIRSMSKNREPGSLSRWNSALGSLRRSPAQTKRRSCNCASPPPPPTPPLGRWHVP